MVMTLFTFEEDLKYLHNYALITDPQAVGSVLNVLDRSPDFAWDLETTGLDHLRDSIHGHALATADQEWYIVGDAVKAFEEKVQPLADTKTIYGHNIKFDVHFLNRINVFPKTMYDTMIMQALLDENQSLGLKSLSERKLLTGELPSFKDLQRWATKANKMKKPIPIHQMPINVLGPYGARDSRLTYDLAKLSLKELAQEGLLDVFTDVEVPFIHILLHMEQAGFYIDRERLEELNILFQTRLKAAQEIWDRVTDGANSESPRQVAQVLFVKLGLTSTEKTDTGQPKTDVMTLNRIKGDDKSGAVAALLEIRKYAKLTKTYVTTFLESLIDGRLHGTFNQSRGEGEDSSSQGTVTWRLSAVKPNLQNVPTRTDEGKMIRSTIAAPSDDYVLIVADCSQLELRLAAHYSKDPMLLKAYQEGLDLHQMTADMIGAKRYVGKTINFLKIYGGGWYKLCDTMEREGYERPQKYQAMAWLDSYDEAYPVYLQWTKNVVRYARRLGHVQTLDGHRRRLPDLFSKIDGLRMRAERQAVNGVIQGSASSIVKRAMLDIAPHLGEFESKMLLQVHDELVFETPKKIAPDFAAFVQEKMQATGKFFNIRVPIVAEPGIGANWAESK
jgi:DNA polymerase-1